MLIPFGVFSAAGAGETNSFELISTTIVGSGGASSVTFSSIPSTYKHLQIRFTEKPVSAAYGGTIYLVANAGADYVGYNHRLFGNGSSVTSASNGNPAQIYGQNIQSNGTTGSFNAGIIDILDYASTSKYKTYRWFFGYTDPTGNRILLGSSGWNSLSAINQLVFSIDDNLAQYSRISLYGVK